MDNRATHQGKGSAGWKRRSVLALALGGALTACAPMMQYHGYAPTEVDLAQIAVGQDTRETVAQKIGQPGMGGVMEGSAWYYVQSDWSHRAWSAAREVDRQVVAISFDQRDRVSNIERFGLADGAVVPISRRVTDSGPRPSVLSQVFRVLGSFTSGGMGVGG